MGPRRHQVLALTIVVLAWLSFGCALTSTYTDRPNSRDDLVDEPLEPLEPGGAADDGVVRSNAEETLFTNTNDGVVRNGPAKQVEITVDVPTRITYIQTYHWNDGAGVAPGKVGLKAADGTPVGMWDAKGTPGQGGVANAYWEVAPDVVLEPGTYVVVDSDPSSQSTNDQMAGCGQTVIRGFPEQ